jgi:hypothetical protein
MIFTLEDWDNGGDDCGCLLLVPLQSLRQLNLSNTTEADSWRVEIAGEGETVVVSWWETNQTSDTPVARISTDAGETFGPMIMLATNGTISSTEEEGAAVGGGAAVA